MSFYVNITGAFRVYGYLKGRHKSIGRLILLLTKDIFSSYLIICVVHNYKWVEIKKRKRKKKTVNNFAELIK